MSAIQLFRDQHKSIRGLFAQLDVVDQRTPDRKEPILKQTFMDLEIHFQLEDEFLFEAMRSQGDAETNAEVEQCYSAHQQTLKRIRYMRTRDIHDEHFNTGLQTFIDEVEEYFDTEEHDLFPLAQKMLSIETLDTMEGRIRDRMKELLSKPEYRDALPEFTQNPNGGEQMRTKKTA